MVNINNMNKNKTSMLGTQEFNSQEQKDQKLKRYIRGAILHVQKLKWRQKLSLYTVSNIEMSKYTFLKQAITNLISLHKKLIDPSKKAMRKDIYEIVVRIQTCIKKSCNYE